MRLIGYWIESLCDPDFYPPQAFVAELDPAIQQATAEYLDSGQEFAVYRGYSWCRFACEHPMGNCELSDGKWVWPVDLSHYVRVHSVKLPDEFIHDALSGMPGIAKKAEWDAIDPDTTYWTEWCRKTAPKRYGEALDLARRQADHEAERILADAAAKLEIETGLSSSTCLWAECGKTALAGKRFCARCIIEDKRMFLVDHVYCGRRRILDALPY